MADSKLCVFPGCEELAGFGVTCDDHTADTDTDFVKVLEQAFTAGRRSVQEAERAEAPEGNPKPNFLVVDPKTKKLDLGSATMQAGCMHSSSATTACGGCYARYVRVIEDIERHLKDGRYYLIESLLISLDLQMRQEFDEVNSKKKGKKR